MTQRGTDDATETFTIDLAQSVYIKGREEPINVNTTFVINKETIDADQPMASLMEIATNHLLRTIDVVREHRYILSDGRHSTFVFMTDEIQSVSLLAPDEETLFAAMED